MLGPLNGESRCLRHELSVLHYPDKHDALLKDYGDDHWQKPLGDEVGHRIGSMSANDAARRSVSYRHFALLVETG